MHRAIDALDVPSKYLVSINGYQGEQQPPQERQVANNELRGVLYPFLKGLASREQEAIHLVYWCDMNYAEAGRHMGISGTSVRVFERNAFRKMFRQAITPRIRPFLY
jgi:RNA polymerase sigma factor (sigma-70 family)